MLAGPAGWVVEAVDVAQLFFEGPGPADVAVGAGDLVDQGAFVVVEFVFPGAQGPARWPSSRGCSSTARPRPVMASAVHRIQGAVGPSHDVERVIADRGVRDMGAGGFGVGRGHIHADHFDLGYVRIRLAFIEIGQGLLAAAGLDVDDGAGVMITDDGQVAVRVAVADLIDPDPIQGLRAGGHRAARPPRG